MLTVLTTAVLGSLAACKTSNARRGQSGVGNSSGVLADVGGIDAEDRDNKSLVYTLHCGDKPAVKGEIRDQDSGKVLWFDGAAVIDGDVCALEVRDGEGAAAPTDVQWLSDPETPGLRYASKPAIVKDRLLALKIIKLYAKTGEESITAILNVRFEDFDTTKTEMAKKFKAVLACHSGKALASTSFSIKPGSNPGSLVGAFTFAKLAIKDLVGDRCDALAVEGDTHSWSGNVRDVVFLNLQANNLVQLPGTTPLYKLDPGELLTGCMKEMAQGKCPDQRAALLPFQQNHWFALVAGKDSAGTVKRYWVTNTNYGAADQESPLIAIKELQIELLRSPLERKRFQFYKHTDEMGFDSKDPKVDAEPATTQLLAIEELVVHGFIPSTVEKVKADRAKPRWLALLVVQTSDPKSTKPVFAEFVTAPAVGFFQGPFADNLLTDPLSFRSGMTMFGMAGRGAPAACKTTASAFTHQLSETTSPSSSPNVDQAFQVSCRLTEAPAFVGGKIVRGVIYLYGWHKII